MLKVAVIGGGSTYTPELIKGFLDRHDSFPLDELWLMDIDPERLQVVGGFAKRIVENAGSPFKVVLSTDQLDSVRDASYVTTQLRVGKMPARVTDEYLGRRHGLIGQETTGVGGMAKALRTIPVLLNLAKDMREAAKPGALLVNFTNPSGLVTEALFRYAPEVPAVGVCNVAIHTKMEILEEFEKLAGEKIDPRRADLKTLGLNHLSWHYGFTLDGEDIWEQVFAAYKDMIRRGEDEEWDIDTIESLGMMPNYYLGYYYYTKKKLAEQEKWPPSRGETVIEIEKELLRQYADPDLKEPPAELMQRGGAWYSTVATQLLNAHYNDLGETHVCNVRHAGAVPGWDPDWVLEMPCRVDRAGIHTLPVEPLPPVCAGLIANVKAYEILTAEAAVTGKRNAARQALLVHPLGPEADQVGAVLEDLLKTNKLYLPQF
jgi:6-phospho-beta-glucosidase